MPRANCRSLQLGGIKRRNGSISAEHTFRGFVALVQIACMSACASAMESAERTRTAPIPPDSAAYNTPIGQNVEVRVAEFLVRYEQVKQAGFTTIASEDVAPALPSNYAEIAASEPLSLRLAPRTGPVTITVPYFTTVDLLPHWETRIRLLAADASANSLVFQDVTVAGSQNSSDKTVQGRIDFDRAVFMLARLVDHGPDAKGGGGVAPGPAESKGGVVVEELVPSAAIDSAPSSGQQAASTSAALSATTASWRRDGDWYRCSGGNGERMEFQVNEKHTWSDLDRPPSSNSFAWRSPDGSHVARFDFTETWSTATWILSDGHEAFMAAGRNEPSRTVLIYYGANCQPLFSKVLAGEVHDVHVLLEGMRLLVSLTSPYSQIWNEMWIWFGPVLLFDQEGRTLFQHGPFEHTDQSFGLFHGGRFVGMHVAGYWTPKSRERKTADLFIDVAKGNHHFYWIDHRKGHEPGQVWLSRDGKLAITYPFLYQDDLDQQLKVEEALPDSIRPKVKVYHEYQFP